MTKLTTITDRNALVQFFNAFRAPARAMIVTRTPVVVRQKDVATKSIENVLFNGKTEATTVFKLQTAIVDLNANYEGEVNNVRALEDKATNFDVEERKWGEHVNATIIKKGDTLYMQTIEIEKVFAVYEMDRVKLDDKGNAVMVNGKPVLEAYTVPYDDFAMFVPEAKPSPKQALNNDVKVRAFKLDNVIGVNIENKVRYSGR